MKGYALTVSKKVFNSTFHILKPIDELVHRQYENVAQQMDKRCPEMRYFGAFLLNVSSWYGLVCLPETPVTTPICIVNGIDMGCNLRGITGPSMRMSQPHEDVDDNDFSMYMDITRIVRCPMFLGGAGMVSSGIYQLFVERNSEGREFLDAGMMLLFWASSMYIKDKDDEILEKDSFLKKGYDWVKKHLKSPSPVRESISLEKIIYL